MKEFNIHDYRRECPEATFIENSLNNCSSSETHLETLRSNPKLKDCLEDFTTACLLYWAYTQYYDDRNRVAVLISRKIVEKFPKLSRKKISDDVLKQAYGFTMCGHRYLQQTFFNVIIQYLKSIPDDKIFYWYKQQEFVINKTLDEAVPYQTWLKHNNRNA